jgi:AraC-like DNA-binding protein
MNRSGNFVFTNQDIIIFEVTYNGTDTSLNSKQNKAHRNVSRTAVLRRTRRVPQIAAAHGQQRQCALLLPRFRCFSPELKRHLRGILILEHTSSALSISLSYLKRHFRDNLFSGQHYCCD